NVVYFSAAGDPNERERAREAFKPLEEWDPRGKFVVAANLNELITSLKRAIGQELVCQVAKADGSPVGEEPLVVTDPNEDLRWWTKGLEPGTYKLRVLADKTYSGEVDL